MSPPSLVPAPPCAPREQLTQEEIERLYRFASIPGAFSEWQDRNCYPRVLDDPTLARTVAPAGTVVSVAGKYALVRDPGTDWLADCAAAGVPASGAVQVTGSDLLTTIERIAATPALSSADIREIGLAKGRLAEGGGALYALALGTPRAVIRVQCFEEIDAMVERAATAMLQAERADAR